MLEFGYEAKNHTLFQAVSDYPETIDFEKFLDLLTARSSAKDSRESLRRVFGLFDDERTGFISLKNLRKVVK